MSALELHRGVALPGRPVREAKRSPAHPERPGVLRRIFAAIARWQQDRADDEARRFIAAHGGRLTDDIERQLTERLNGGRGFAP